MSLFADHTHAGRRSAFYAKLANEPNLRRDVRKCYDSRPQYASAGVALHNVVGNFEISLVDLVLFLKDVTPAELAIINDGRDADEEANA